MNAYQDLLKELQETEVVEGLVFSGGEGASEGEIPEELVGKVLSLDEAKSVMLNWSFYGDYGGADCPAAVIWTNHRVIFVGVYAGATWLSSVPRDPKAFIPDYYGGW